MKEMSGIYSWEKVFFYEDCKYLDGIFNVERAKKVIVVCDSKLQNKLTNGLSYIAESIHQFNIDVLLIELDKEINDKIISAQIRQKMINTTE